MTDRRELVLHAPLHRALWSLSWPIAVSNELSILTLGVLLFWLGQLTGETGLVVESAFRPFGLMVAWLFNATSVGASVLVSRAVGAADGRGLTLAAGTVSLTVALSAVFAAVVLPISPWLADLLAGDLAVDRALLHFLLAWLIVALPALSVAEVLLDVANSTGATRFNLVRVLIDLALMAALAPILIDMAGMGPAGGQLAEGLGAAALCVVLWLALVRRRSELALGELAPRAWRFSRALAKEVLAIGVPVQVGRTVAFAVQLVLLQLVMRDGGAAVAGYGIASALLLVGSMATLALAQSGAIIVGQALGAGLVERARRGVRATLIAGWIAMAVFVIGTLADRAIVGLFTSDPEVTDAAVRALAILRWAGFGIAGWQILLQAFAAHRATVRASVLMIAGEGAALAVAFAWPGSHLDAVCVAFVAANALKALLLLGLAAHGALARARAAKPA